MQKYLSLGVLLFMGLLSIYFYYIYYPIHGGSKDFLLIYLVVISIVYGIHKLVSSLISSDKIKINSSQLIMYFFLQLFIVCICFFAFTTGNISYGIILFFKILGLLLPVSLLWVNFYCLGDTVLGYANYLGIGDKGVRILSSLGTGFTVFMLGIFTLTSLGFYNIQWFLLFFCFTMIISYKSWIEILYSFKNPIKTYSFSLSKKANFSDRYNTGLLIDELHYIVITFLISVNLVSVYRPFPIGWDDLGAYMNYPKLLTGAGEHIALGKMYLWELYTGIGFLFGSQTLAFYLNSFSGIIVAVVAYLSISSLIKKKEGCFDLGLLSSMIILMMPMTIFQLAKDMKLDFGLLFISIISFSLFYYVLFSKEKKNNFLYILIGIFIGVAFTIKVTSLLLLLGALSALFYKKYSLGGFIGFLGVFLGIFSYLNLWKMMNVVVPADEQSLKYFALISILLGIVIFFFTHTSQKKKIGNLTTLSFNLGALLLGFILILLPWGVKHVGEIQGEAAISAGNLVSGHADRYSPDYSLIFTEEELEKIESTKALKVTKKGTTTNADFGRYFGYEEGINNYLKLPWNLTFQVNQKGEFTDITYIFFALLPALFLFLPYRKEVYKYPVVGVMLLSLIYFIPGPLGVYLKELFSTITLPAGYLFIGLLSLLPLVYFHFTLDKTNKISRIFLVNLAFSTIYIGLWAISAFGIVWYGILMYILFLLMITLCLASAESQGGKTSKYASYITLSIVWIYILQSAIPHGITNLRNAGYPDYKLGGMSEENALMSFHPEYFNILFELNIGDEHKENMFIEYRNKLLEIIDDTQFSEGLMPQLQALDNISNFHDVLRQLIHFDLKSDAANDGVMNLQQSLYEDILYIEKEIKNSKNIYRVGTFLKYYISGNNTRLFEDSLLTHFDDYIYDENQSISIERFNKLDIGYILLDVNAATIDKDPSRNLTQRYENLLALTSNDKLDLIETDSICLRIAIDRYKKDLDLGKFIDIAAVNYSYLKSSSEKKAMCIQEMITILSDDQKGQIYNYLTPYVRLLEREEIIISDTAKAAEMLAKYIPNGYKALFKIK